jgi:hypothetical protein
MVWNSSHWPAGIRLCSKRQVSLIFLVFLTYVQLTQTIDEIELIGLFPKYKTPSKVKKKQWSACLLILKITFRYPMFKAFMYHKCWQIMLVDPLLKHLQGEGSLLNGERVFFFPSRCLMDMPEKEK